MCKTFDNCCQNCNKFAQPRNTKCEELYQLYKKYYLFSDCFIYGVTDYSRVKFCADPNDCNIGYLITAARIGGNPPNLPQMPPYLQYAIQTLIKENVLNKIDYHLAIRPQLSNGRYGKGKLYSPEDMMYLKPKTKYRIEPILKADTPELSKLLTQNFQKTFKLNYAIKDGQLQIKQIALDKPEYSAIKGSKALIEIEALHNHKFNTKMTSFRHHLRNNYTPISNTINMNSLGLGRSIDREIPLKINIK